MISLVFVKMYKICSMLRLVPNGAWKGFENDKLNFAGEWPEWIDFTVD